MTISVILFFLAVVGMVPGGDSTVLFTHNHGEGYDIWGRDLTGFLEFSRLLEDEGFTILSLNRGSIDDEVLKGVDVVVISYPEEQFSEEEMDALKGYVEKGGSLVVFGGVDALNQTNPLIGIFGLEISNGIIVVNDSVEFSLDVPGDAPHPIFAHVRTYQQINTPSVRVLEGPAEVFGYPDMGGKEGLFAIKEVGKGKVLVTGDADFLNNIFLHNYDNAQLGVNIISFMAGRPIEPINTGNKGDKRSHVVTLVGVAFLLFISKRYLLKTR